MKNNLNAPSQNEGLTLAQSHPTLYKESFFFRECISKDHYKDIQFCTVDVAEHDLIKTAYDAEQEVRLNLEDEVERLKKELEELDDAVTETWYNKGIAEGERRAMQRVKEAIMRLGMVDEGFKGFGIMVGPSELLKELGLGEESADNGSYQNKEDK